ncbi:MAG TPA: plasmid mobilization relaxosome protein MobC [Patescibacteria group bacterium]|nr:plasmid mobilization relaxosome protein MobC [Patescibacteria group bacterium]
MSNGERLRNKIVQFWVTEKEYDVIKDKAKYCELCMSAYLRKVGVDGFIINRDFSGLNDVNRIGASINQIAKKVNERGSVIDRDLDELRVQYEKLFEVLYGQIISG